MDNDVQALTTPPEPRDAPLSRRQRTLELLLVLAVACLSAVLASLCVLFTGASLSPDQTRYGSAGLLVGVGSQITSLAVAQYVLSQQGRGWRQIGLSFAWKDIGWSALLFLAAAVATRLWEWLLYHGGYWLTGHTPHMRPVNVEFLHDNRAGLPLALLTVYSLINPFREELIVRAYLMSEVRALTGSVRVAVFASVGLQVSYHFYQGLWPALTYIPLFLTFALYYARTRRILPVILAHLYFDILALLSG